MEVVDVLNTKVFVITPNGCTYRKGNTKEETKHRKHLLDIANILYPNNCLDLEMRDDDIPLDLGNFLRMLGNIVILNSPSFYGKTKYLIVLVPNYCNEVQSMVLRYYLEYFKDYKLDYSEKMPCSFNYLDNEGFDTTNDNLTPREAYDRKVLRLTKKSAG
mgnify:CR=1 FL=1